MLKIKKFFINTSGIAAVEFALIAPILLYILIATIDIGLYLNDKIKLEFLARAATEYLLVTQDEELVVQEVLAPYYDSEQEANWQEAIDLESDMVCACEGGEEIECDLGICTGEGDYKRRFYEVSISKTHETLFVYPGFPSVVELVGTAKLQLD
jgi:Flp pilus assembly pilin Flp